MYYLPNDTAIVTPSRRGDDRGTSPYTVNINILLSCRVAVMVTATAVYGDRSLYTVLSI